MGNAEKIEAEIVRFDERIDSEVDALKQAVAAGLEHAAEEIENPEADGAKQFAELHPIDGTQEDWPVYADPRDPDNGNASHEYLLVHGTCEAGTENAQQIHFQQGPRGEVGINGVTNEQLLAVVIDRLEGFQTSRFACFENANALEHARKALDYLNRRTRARLARGVEGTNIP